MDFLFFFNSFLIGIGLAMDAFSVSLANGLNEPTMSRRKQTVIAGVFGAFQGAMPLIGWICVHTIVEQFKFFQAFVPYIALALLLFIGIKMIVEGFQPCEDGECKNLCIKTILIQGVATSIDALSVGFTIAEYSLLNAVVCTAIIALVTFICCFVGVELGKKFGTKFSNKASIFGGAILVLIGLEIFITGVFF
ncbi:MAG: manganese efflux pump [Clostridia bacterium]|nr:manganese efflux pump [Clostridia bacterium]